MEVSDKNLPAIVGHRRMPAGRPQPIRYRERVDWAADPSEITTQRVEGTFRLLGGHTKNPPVMGASGFLYAVLWPFRVGVRLPTQMNEGHRVRILAL
jgi:hypothetical protein